VTGNPWIRSRGEEDVTVWDKLKGDEMEIAKSIILDELKKTPDSAYIRAVGIFKDDCAIPILKNIITSYSERFIIEKLLSAKILYDLIGYNNYFHMLETACKRRDDAIHVYLKHSISQFTNTLKKKDRIRIMIALGEPFLGRSS
jgi:hypothetical protein